MLHGPQRRNFTSPSMFHVRSYLGVLGWAAFLVLVGSSVARGEFVIIDQSVLTNPATQQTTFKLTFNERPDFFEADEFDRPRNAFQYFFDTDPAASPEGFRFDGPGVSIIRGPEIRFGEGIPVRDSINETGEEFPHAEGWGPERGRVKFDLEGKELSFSVPWKTLGQTSADFSYHVIALEFGTQTSEFAGTSVGLPSAVKTGGILLLVIALVTPRCASPIVRLAHLPGRTGTPVSPSS